MKKALMRILRYLLWSLIQGSSRLVFDQEQERVKKVVQPRTFVRLLHLLAFQRWTTLYETEIGLQIASYRRELLRWVLRCAQADCRIAPCLGTETQDGKLALVTHWIKGRHPRREEIAAISQQITTLFLGAGLPTWSVCLHHPRVETNFMIDPEGQLWIIDYESHVLGIFASFKEVWENLLLGNFPPFDEIHFPILWRFYRHKGWRLPEEERGRFRACIEQCQALVREQKSQEIRIWSRFLVILFFPLRLRREYNHGIDTIS